MRQKYIRLVILALAAFLVLMLVWHFFVQRSFIHVTLGDGVDSVQIVDGSSGRVLKTASGSSLITNLPVGNYTLHFFKGKDLAGVETGHVKAFSYATVALSPSDASSKPLAFLHRHADLVTPLGKGYIYINQLSRGVEYADSTGIVDMSDSLSLTRNTTAVRDVVINLISLQSGDVLIVTTKASFIVHSPSNVSRLPTEENDPNYTTSAYDSKTNSLFLLSAYSYKIYRYDLTQLANKPASFYSGDRFINRLSAGGGKLVAYYDAVPNLDANVLDEYNKTRQLAPIVIDIPSKQVEKTFEDEKGTTYASVSQNGSYVAIKRKFASTMSIYNLTDQKKAIIPAFDTSGVSWKGDLLYLGRGNAIWSYDPTTEDVQLTKIADTTGPVTYILCDQNQVIATTNDNTSSLMVAIDQDTKNSIPTQLLQLVLENDSYLISFVALNNNAVVYAQPANILTHIPTGDSSIRDGGSNTNTTSYDPATDPQSIADVNLARSVLSPFSTNPRVTILNQAPDPYELYGYQKESYALNNQ